MSGSRTLPPRWPPQCSCVVIESSFDPGERLQAPGSLWYIIELVLILNIIEILLAGHQAIITFYLTIADFFNVKMSPNSQYSCMTWICSQYILLVYTYYANKTFFLNFIKNFYSETISPSQTKLDWNGL